MMIMMLVIMVCDLFLDSTNLTFVRKKKFQVKYQSRHTIKNTSRKIKIYEIMKFCQKIEFGNITKFFAKIEFGNFLFVVTFV